MKGIPGLVVAIVFGLLGSVVNMYYLWKGRNIETQAFVGIKEDVQVARGRVITKDYLEPVRIPVDNVGNLRDFAYVWDDWATVVGQKSSRTYNGGELMMTEDLRTPPPYLNLKATESAVFIKVDNSTAITSLIIPDVTPVSFYLPRSRALSSSKQPTEGGWEWLGPFDVLTVGNRLGSPLVMDASNISQQYRDVLTLRVTYDEAGQMAPKMEDLYNYVHRTNNAPLGVMVHPPRRGTPEP